MVYAIQVRNRESGVFETLVEGQAASRRKFLRANGASRRVKNEHGYTYRTEAEGTVGSLIKEKKQWRCVATS